MLRADVQGNLIEMVMDISEEATFDQIKKWSQLSLVEQKKHLCQAILYFEKSFPLFTRESMVAACNFTYKNPNFNPALFSVTTIPFGKGLGNEPVWLGKIFSDNALKKLAEKGKRSKTFEEAMAWFAANPNKKGTFVVLGATCEIDNKVHVLVLRRYGSCRGLYLHSWADVWFVGSQFLIEDL